MEELGLLLTGAFAGWWCWRSQGQWLDRAATAFILACGLWIVAASAGLCLAFAFGFRPFHTNICFGFSLCCAISSGVVGVASWFTSPKEPEGSGFSPGEE